MMPISWTRSSIREITVHVENQTAYIDANVIMSLVKLAGENGICNEG